MKTLTLLSLKKVSGGESGDDVPMCPDIEEYIR